MKLSLFVRIIDAAYRDHIKYHKIFGVILPALQKNDAPQLTNGDHSSDKRR